MIGKDYEALMVEADRHGVAIGISVGDLQGPKGAQYRPLTWLTAERGDKAVRQPITGGDLDGAARRLQTQLPQ